MKRKISSLIVNTTCESVLVSEGTPMQTPLPLTRELYSVEVVVIDWGKS